MAGWLVAVLDVLLLLVAVGDVDGTSRRAMAADYQAVFVVGQVLERRLPGEACGAPCVDVVGVHEEAVLVSRTAEPSVKPFVWSAVAVEPLTHRLLLNMRWEREKEGESECVKDIHGIFGQD